MDKATTIDKTPSLSTINISSDDVPAYLKKFYWWAYLHPNAIRIFERQWLVNWILWGNYRRLRDSALAEIGNGFPGKMLQIACVYGDLSERILARLAPDGRLDLADVSLAQLRNSQNKLGERKNLRLLREDSTNLSLDDDTYDVSLLFFLLHEQPAEARLKTLSEAIRLTRKDGRLIIVDYHKASRWNPLGYLMRLVYRLLEPFASDFVDNDLKQLLLQDKRVRHIEKTTCFGGLYQKLIVHC